VSPPFVGLAFFGLLVGLPMLTSNRRGASPRVAAGAYLVSLVGWALLPTVWLLCLGSAVGSWLSGTRSAGGGCLFGLDRSGWAALVGYVPSAAALGFLAWHGLQQAMAARRAEMRGVALETSVRRPTSAGEVWVVPSARLVACAAGLWRCRAVVSSGLLAPLGAREREAVCEHEAAHVRLGHPRLLVFGGAVAAAYGGFMPVRRAWDGLRRELEAAADDEAARVAGHRALLSALVQVVVMGRGASADLAAGFGEADNLLWRIARLENPRPAESWPTALVGAAALTTSSAMAFVGCLLVGAPATLLGVFACLGIVTAVSLRPTWGWRRRAPAL
jgi:Zn-dependent protease with chaperone function